jgi:hypothetical protein
MPIYTRTGLSVVRGDLLQINLTVVGAGGAPVDVSGYTPSAKIADRAGVVTVTGSVDTTDAALGLLVVSFDADDNEGLLPSSVYELQVRLVDGGDVRTVLAAALTVYPSLFVV